MCVKLCNKERLFYMGRKEKEYIVYDRETDFPIVLGTTTECCKALNVSKGTFRNLVFYKTKYDIFELDKLLKDYNEDKIFNK